MPCPVTETSKFVGITSLGLLSSSALTLSLTTLPALIALPSPSEALPIYQKLKQHTAAAQSLLTAGSGAALAVAFFLSPRRLRHPYLLWMGLTVGLGSFAVPRLVAGGRGHDLALLSATGSAADEDGYEQIELAEQGRGRQGGAAGASAGARELRVNGEVVREAVAAWKSMLAWQSLVWGVGWAMGTVGIWGEGA